MSVLKWEVPLSDSDFQIPELFGCVTFCIANKPWLVCRQVPVIHKVKLDNFQRWMICDMKFDQDAVFINTPSDMGDEVPRF
jgi:hypothetical protein